MGRFSAMENHKISHYPLTDSTAYAILTVLDVIVQMVKSKTLSRTGICDC